MSLWSMTNMDVKQLPTSITHISGYDNKDCPTAGAGNLLGRAGDDLSGLPDRARRYHFFFDSIIFQFKH